jgi:hypothetical protein
LPWTDELGGSTRDRSAGLSDLTVLWQAALTPLLHGSGCGCRANPVMVLRSDWLEDDILDYLQRQPDLAAAVTAIELRVSSKAGDFVGWLKGLETAGLDSTVADRLRERVRTLLQSLGRRSPLGRTCG